MGYPAPNGHPSAGGIHGTLNTTRRRSHHHLNAAGGGTRMVGPHGGNEAEAPPKADEAAVEAPSAITTALSSGIADALGRSLSDAPSAVGGTNSGGGGHGGLSKVPPRSRFFEPPLESWLNVRGAAAHLERCGKGADVPCPFPGAPSVRLSRQIWWPFNCTV